MLLNFSSLHAGAVYSYFTYMETEAQRKYLDQDFRTLSGTGGNACCLNPDPVLLTTIPHGPVKMYLIEAFHFLEQFSNAY